MASGLLLGSVPFLLPQIWFGLDPTVGYASWFQLVGFRIVGLAVVLASLVGLWFPRVASWLIVAGASLTAFCIASGARAWVTDPTLATKNASWEGAVTLAIIFALPLLLAAHTCRPKPRSMIIVLSAMLAASALVCTSSDRPLYLFTLLATTAAPCAVLGCLWLK